MSRCVLPTLFVLFFVGGLSPTAQAIPSDTTDEAERWVVSGAVGIAHPRIASLNRILRVLGYPSYTAAVPSVGIRGVRRMGAHLRVGAEGHVYPWGTGLASTGRAVTLRGGYGLLTVGYQFRPLPSVPALRVVPTVGGGAGLLRLRISGRATSVSGALQDPANSSGSTLQRRSLLVSAAVGVEYHLLRDTPAHVRLGLQAGYLAAPTATRWLIDGHTSASGPDAGLGGPFVRLVIGRGW